MNQLTPGERYYVDIGLRSFDEKASGLKVYSITERVVRQGAVASFVKDILTAIHRIPEWTAVAEALSEPIGKVCIALGSTKEMHNMEGYRDAKDYRIGIMVHKMALDQCYYKIGIYYRK